MPTKNKKSKGSKAKAAAPVEEIISETADALSQIKLSNRTCTGNLASKPIDRDVKITAFSLAYHGKVLIQETELELK